MITWCEQPREIVNSEGVSFIKNAFYWLCYESKKFCDLLMPSVYITPWSKVLALPAGCREAPASTAKHWDRSCSQKHSKWPSGCWKCWVARSPSLWLLPFLCLQMTLTDTDEWCGVLHAGAVVVTSHLCTSQQVIIKINTSVAAAASLRAYLLPLA